MRKAIYHSDLLYSNMGGTFSFILIFVGFQGIKMECLEGRYFYQQFLLPFGIFRQSNMSFEGECFALVESALHLFVCADFCEFFTECCCMLEYNFSQPWYNILMT